MQPNRKTSRRLCFIVCGIALVQLLIHSGVIAQTPGRLKDLNEIKEIVSAGKYQDAISKLKNFRSQDYGKTFEVDYLLGLSLCRMERRQEGLEYLNTAINYSGVDENSIKDAKQEADWCRADSDSIRLRPAPKKTNVRSGSSSTGRKTWFETRVYRPYESAAFEPREELSSEALDRRLIELSQPAAAIRQFRSLNLGPFNRIEVVGHFILASTTTLRPRDLRRIGEDLEQTLNYFVSNFQMQKPRYYIKVFIVPHPIALDSAARRIHHLNLMGDTIGYSYTEDLSMAAIVWRMVYGTLKHELFHLLVRSNFGNIPAWLDEGMAALYENSHQVAGRIVGVRNWRGGVLREEWANRLSLQSLLEMDWTSFNKVDWSSKQVLTNHALVRYFILYLQEVGKLSYVYNTIRESELDYQSQRRSIMAVESAFGKSIAAVDADFSDWFLRLPVTPAENRHR